MPTTLAGETIQLWVANPNNPASFSAITGELRSRLDIEQSLQRNPAIRTQRFGSIQTNSGSTNATIEVEGLSNHDPAEQWLQSASLSGEPRILRLKINSTNWLEGSFIITRFSLDALMENAAQFRFSAISHGTPILTPLPA